jgi:hypothetical protein
MTGKIIVLLSFLWALGLQGQIYTSHHSTFTAGVASQQAGGISHAGAMGSWLSTPMNSANYEHQHESVALPVPLSSAGAPLLTVTRSGNNVRIAWPASATGFVLEGRVTLDASSNWEGVDQEPEQSGEERFLLLPASAAQSFYRLAVPDAL